MSLGWEYLRYASTKYEIVLHSAMVRDFIRKYRFAENVRTPIQAHLGSVNIFESLRMFQ